MGWADCVEVVVFTTVEFPAYSAVRFFSQSGCPRCLTGSLLPFGLFAGLVLFKDVVGAAKR